MCICSSPLMRPILGLFCNGGGADVVAAPEDMCVPALVIVDAVVHAGIIQGDSPAAGREHASDREGLYRAASRASAALRLALLGGIASLHTERDNGI